MPLSELTTPLRRRARGARTDRRAASRGAEVLPTTRDAAERRDASRGSGPQDTAVYACGCGFIFTASVTTTVACPHCEADQAW